MLFNRRRVALFLAILFLFMAAIYLYTNELIEDQMDRFGEDLLRIQTSMVLWVSEGFRNGDTTLETKLQDMEDVFINQQFQILSSLILNAEVSFETDSILIESFSDGKYGIVTEQGNVNYSGNIPSEVVLEAYSAYNKMNPTLDAGFSEFSKVSIGQLDAVKYEFYFYKIEKLKSVLFTGVVLSEKQYMSGFTSTELDAYLSELYETRGYESYIVSLGGQILNASAPSKVGSYLIQTDKNTGVSLFQRMIDNPDQQFQLLLDEPYEAFSTPFESGYMLLMKPTRLMENTNQSGMFLGYTLILINMLILTSMMIFLRKNHAFVIEKISLTELQVQNRRRAAGFIVVIIVFAFAASILLVHGLLSIQLAQFDFDRELKHFSGAMAVQYSEAYESLELQNQVFSHKIKNNEVQRLIDLYEALKGFDAETLLKYPYAANSNIYQINWLKGNQSARNYLISQHGVDINQVVDYQLISQENSDIPMILIGYDRINSIVWVIQRFEDKSAEADLILDLTLPESGLSVEGLFAHYRLEEIDSIPILLTTIPDTQEAHLTAEAIGIDIYNKVCKDTIGIQKLDNEDLIVFSLVSEPLRSDLKRASYLYTRTMNIAIVMLLLIALFGWQYYSRKGTES